MIKAKQNHINLLKQEIALVRIEDQLKVKKTQDIYIYIYIYINKKLTSLKR